MIYRRGSSRDGGEGEEEQAHRDEHVARGLAEDDAEGGLGEVGLLEHVLRRSRAAAMERAALGVEGGDDDEGVRVRTTKVSMNTPIMATTPCWWGFLTLACAWA